jgi:hypothetical protein
VCGTWLFGSSSRNCLSFMVSRHTAIVNPFFPVTIDGIECAWRSVVC